MLSLGAHAKNSDFVRHPSGANLLEVHRRFADDQARTNFVEMRSKDMGYRQCPAREEGAQGAREGKGAELSAPRGIHGANACQHVLGMRSPAGRMRLCICSDTLGSHRRQQ